jgi:hypothetical protein
MESIENWRGELIPVARSRGGVVACADPLANVLRGDVSPWPPPELVQKLYQSRQVRAFAGEHLVACKSVLEYYCDLQSLNSEDALTWSCFGPLVYAEARQRLAFTSALLGALGIEHPETREAALWLWRRIPHPDSLVPGGPEIDVGVQTPTALVLGEAKWRSSVGKGQGTAGDKDQIQLRVEFCTKYGARLYPECRDFVVLSIGVADEPPRYSPSRLANGSVVSHRCISWTALAKVPGHPRPSELSDYIDWKARLTLAA